MTLGDQWAYKPNDRIKSLEQCVQTLVRCAGGDGNLLLNVGPMPTGAIDPRQAQRLREIGSWLGRYGESIYGTRGGPLKPTKTYATTRKGNTVYLHVFAWDGETVKLPPVEAKIVATRVLSGGSSDRECRHVGVERDPARKLIASRSTPSSGSISIAPPRLAPCPALIEPRKPAKEPLCPAPWFPPGP